MYAYYVMIDERERRRLTATRGIPAVTGYEGSVLKVLRKEAVSAAPAQEQKGTRRQRVERSRVARKYGRGDARLQRVEGGAQGRDALVRVLETLADFPSPFPPV